MSDALILRSGLDLIDSLTSVIWSNKYVLPKGYVYNDLNYVITNEPKPMIKVCLGMAFGFLIKKLGVKNYVRQNIVAMRLLNPDTHSTIVSSALYHALKRACLYIDRTEYDALVKEVYDLTTVPALDGNFISWRRTWFSEACDYDTIAKIVRLENNNKIDSDRELMTLQTKYITLEVASFTGFSRSKIDRYWSEKQWDKRFRTMCTLNDAIIKLEGSGIDDPSRTQLAEASGLSVSTISTAMKNIEQFLEDNRFMIK